MELLIVVSTTIEKYFFTATSQQYSFRELNRSSFSGVEYFQRFQTICGQENFPLGNGERAIRN